MSRILLSDPVSAVYRAVYRAVDRARPELRLARRVGVILLSWILAVPVLAQDASQEAPRQGPVNPFCPVTTTEPVQDGVSLEYGDVEIGFCCEDCLSLFERDPERYLEELPPEVAEAVREARAEESSATGISGLVGPADFRWSDHLELVIFVVVLLLAALGWRRKTESGRRLATGLVMAGLAGLAAFSWWRAEVARAEMAAAHRELQVSRWKELIHNNTYYDFGDPPRPLRPPVEPRLQATFYRGNDERRESLFNGGNYLTAYFDLAIVDSLGRPVEHGQDVGGERMTLRMEIRRGPHTPDFFWTDDLMGDIFLTADSDPFLGYESPVTDRRDLKTVEKMQRWRAIYPLGHVVRDGETSLHAVIYVAEPWFEGGGMIGATFHYGIEVRLDFADGRISDGSEIFMNALFRPRKSPYSRVPPEEWFSHEPIPPLPAPQGDDPESLGIDDYRR